MAGTSGQGASNTAGVVAAETSCPITIPAPPTYLSNFSSWVYVFAAVGIVWALVVHFKK